MLLANPYLGTLVKHISFGGCYAVRDRGAAPIRLNEREMKTVQDMILEAQLPMKTVWIKTYYWRWFFRNPVVFKHSISTTAFSRIQSFLNLLFKHALLSNQSSAHRVSDFSALYHVRFTLTQSFEYQGMGDVSMDRDKVKELFFLPAIEIIEAVVF